MYQLLQLRDQTASFSSVLEPLVVGGLRLRPRGNRDVAAAARARAIACSASLIWHSIMNTTELWPSPVFGPSSMNRFG